MKKFFFAAVGVFLFLGVTLLITKHWWILPQLRHLAMQSNAITEHISDVAWQFDQIIGNHLDIFTHLHSFNEALTLKQTTHTSSRLWVDRCEVRQKDFVKFIKWTKLHPDQSSVTHQPPNWEYYSSSSAHKISGRLSAPATGISYFDAEAYCHFANGRLPTSEEWQAIAGGEEGRLYPWGNTFIQDGYPFYTPRRNAAQKCGLYADLASKDGVQDMGNSVSEWATNGTYVASIHGGNAYNQPRTLYSLNALYRFAPINYRSPYVGFRCVYKALPPKPPWGQIPPKSIEIPARNYRIGPPQGAKYPFLLLNIPRKRIDVVRDIFRSTHQNPNYALMRLEVSRLQYLIFLADPLVQLHLYANQREPDNHSYLPSGWDYKNDLTLPANGIDWWSAYAFSQWAGGNLPSVAQWNKAWSGRGGTLYPWGDKFEDDIGIMGYLRTTNPKPVDENLGDVTKSGLFNMGGNVSEWTNNISVKSVGLYGVLKGGNYKIPGKQGARIDFFWEASLSIKLPVVGFRLVFDRGTWEDESSL